MTAVAKSVTQAATLDDASSSVVPANPEVVAVPGVSNSLRPINAAFYLRRISVANPAKSARYCVAKAFIPRT